MRRIGLYGGGFDPPHIAHVMCAAYALSIGRMDELWVLPSWEHAFDKDMTPFPHRMAMCERAFASMPQVKVSDLERQWQVKYTIDLVHGLQVQSAVQIESLVLIVGSDNAALCQQWHRWDDLCRMVDLLVVPRSGGVTQPEGFVMPDVSSTEARLLMQNHEGAPWGVLGKMLPRLVVDYIRDHGLYAKV